MVKSINKKILLDKFILISVILVFVNMYSKIFGNENILIGVTVITAVLMFKEMDLGYNLKQSYFSTENIYTRAYLPFILMYVFMKVIAFLHLHF